MSQVYKVTVSDDDAEALKEFSDDRIQEVLRDALNGLTSASDKRDELRRRRPEPTSEDTEELSGEALEQAMRDWLRRKRDSDPRLD